VLCSAVVMIGMLAVTLCEHGAGGGVEARARFLVEAFEVVSAFGAVGLSAGITPELSDASWYVLVAIMFIGRVGALTLGLALAGREPRFGPRYAEEELVVG
jgi:trk system potassium uptake protein TrkH